MLRMGAWLGRKTKNDIELGICGEHGGDPDSIEFFQHSGIDYVSCSPFRVPVARVAAAQAARARGDADGAEAQLSSVMNARGRTRAAHSWSVLSHAVRRTFSPSRS